MTITEDVAEKEWLLKATDRCDSCPSEALVKVTGISGDLMFCGHHYNKIMNDAGGYKKMTMEEFQKSMGGMGGGMGF